VVTKLHTIIAPHVTYPGWMEASCINTVITALLSSQVGVENVADHTEETGVTRHRHRRSICIRLLDFQS